MHKTETDLSTQLAQSYAALTDAPTAAQWRAVLELPPDQPFILVNCFKFRERAAYSASAEAPASGQEAFARYAAVSTRVAAQAGVDFLHIGPVVGCLFGVDEEWDLVVVARYPKRESFIELFSDPEYLAAVHHRTAACATQRVLVSRAFNA